MDFGTTKLPVDIITEGAFGETYFRCIYSAINSKCYRKLWKEFDNLKNTDQKYYSLNYYDTAVYKYNVKCGTSQRF